ncbi:MAG: DUF1640 domain-containing protein [Gammaproteobacteria bacterium]|nr:MAG: DUF1640 domain-containing protein [Gammaproteobacteria bacterium]
MAVQAASLEILEKAAVPPAQARAIVQAIEIEIAGAKDTLATKQDVLILRHEIAELRTELRSEMTELRTELRSEMTELRTELRSEMTELGTELRSKMTELRREVEGKLSQSEFHAAMTSSVRHMYGAIMGQFALLLGVAYFFVSHVPH